MGLPPQTRSRPRRYSRCQQFSRLAPRSSQTGSSPIDRDTDSNSRHLVDAAQSGNLPALEELLVHHLPGLRAFIRLRAGALIRDRESASDLAQSVCREVLQNLDRFQYGGEAGFKHWLYATALRRIQKRHAYWKTLKRDVAREQAPPAEAGGDLFAAAYRSVSSPSKKVMGREDLDRIERAFDALAEGEREIITLTRLVGLSHDEVAKTLDKSVGATRVQLHRALAHLAILLDVESAS